MKKTIGVVAIICAALFVYLIEDMQKAPPPPRAAMTSDTKPVESAHEPTPAELIAKRHDLAERIDQALINQGLESRTEARGKTLMIHFALVGRVAADRFGKALPFDEIRDAEFTKVVLTDDNGTSFSWRRYKDF